MIINSLMATLHHLCAFAVTATLVYEFVAFRRNLTVEEARRILKIDTAYGISAGLLVIVGEGVGFLFEQYDVLGQDGSVYFGWPAVDLSNRSLSQVAHAIERKQGA
jgi:hypothetical protein